MKIKTLVLTLILVVGFSFSNCDRNVIDCNCPPVLDFFDIQGLELINYKKSGECCTDKISENEEVNFLDYHNLLIHYEVDYISQSHKNWNFSLMNSALACSCIADGALGSKEEKLNSLSIITLNDFDSNHLANDTINDLFDVKVVNDLVDLDEYISQDTSLIQSQFLELNLKKAPELNKEFRIKVIVNLSNNETYESESAPIRIN